MNNNLAKALGDVIRTLRKEKGFSQESFAYKVTLHRTYIGAVERGEKNITIKNLEKIAFALEIKISELFLLTENKKTFKHC